MQVQIAHRTPRAEHHVWAAVAVHGAGQTGSRRPNCLWPLSRAGNGSRLYKAAQANSGASVTCNPPVMCAKARAGRRIPASSLRNGYSVSLRALRLINLHRPERSKRREGAASSAKHFAAQAGRSCFRGGSCGSQGNTSAVECCRTTLTQQTNLSIPRQAY
jgi:hypothetical protein